MEDVKTIFTPIKSQRRTFEEVSIRIKKLIIEGTLGPGDKLPPEGELAKQFNVGRQTIREALRILELSGFITVQKGFGGGVIVKDSISSKITNLLFDAFQMEKISIEEFVIARLAIEKDIMNEVIAHVEEEDIEKLQENILKAKKMISDGKHATDLNFDFHSLLAKASKNNVFIIVERAINAIHYNLRSKSNIDLKTSKKAVQDHERILDAVTNKNREGSIRLVEKHILAVSRDLDPQK